MRRMYFVRACIGKNKQKSEIKNYTQMLFLPSSATTTLATKMTNADVKQTEPQEEKNKKPNRPPNQYTQ